MGIALCVIGCIGFYSQTGNIFVVVVLGFFRDGNIFAVGGLGICQGVSSFAVDCLGY
jgi:predicted secreted protein